VAGVKLQPPAGDGVVSLQHQGVFHVRVIDKFFHLREEGFDVLIHAQPDAGGVNAYTGVIASLLHIREPAKKPVVKVKRRRRKTTAKKKEPEAKQGDYLIGTDENVLVLSRTYANRGNAGGLPKCSGDACSALQ